MVCDRSLGCVALVVEGHVSLEVLDEHASELDMFP